MSETADPELVKRSKEYLQKTHRSQIVDQFIDVTNGKNSKLGSSDLKMLGGTEDTLRGQIENIIANLIKKHPDEVKFRTVEQFIDHAIEMQLIWWGNNPQIFLGKVEELTITKEQKEFMIKFQEQQDKRSTDKVLGLDQNVDDDFVKLQKNIDKWHNKEITFNESLIEKNLMYDTYPLLWKYYSRLLPIKATLHIINYIAQKNDKPYFELSDSNLDLAFSLLMKIGNKLTKYDETNKLKRNDKIGTGFPSNIEPSEKKPIDEEEQKKQLKSKITKMESIKNRFKSHLIGKKSRESTFEKIKKDSTISNLDENYKEFTNALELMTELCNKENADIKLVKKNWNEMKQVLNDSTKILDAKIKNSVGSYQGALNALDLVIPHYDGKVTKLFISSKGHEFLKLKNPILDDLELLDDSEQNKFSTEEVEFILGTLIPTKLSLEHKMVSNIISELNNKSKLDADDVEKTIINSCVNWAYEYPEVFETNRFESHIANYYGWEAFTRKIDTDMPAYVRPEDVSKEEITAWRMATMGRLSEMGVIDWQMKEKGAAEYSKGKNFGVISNLPVLSRKEIIDSREDYQKILQK